MNDKFKFKFQVFISSARSHLQRGKILLVVGVYVYN